MSWITIILLVIAALVDTFAAYISRVYSEFGKILSREVQDNLHSLWIRIGHWQRNKPLSNLRVW